MRYYMVTVVYQTTSHGKIGFVICVSKNRLMIWDSLLVLAVRARKAREWLSLDNLLKLLLFLTGAVLCSLVFEIRCQCIFV